MPVAGVAVTVISDVTVGAVEYPVELEQPVIRPRPATLTASKISNCKMRRRFLMPKQHSARARAVAGKNGLGPVPRVAVAFVVEIVTIADTGPPAGVTVAGVMAQVAPVGSPEVQASVIAKLNPFSGVTVIIVATLCPAVTVTDVGLAVTVKSGAVGLMM